MSEAEPYPLRTDAIRPMGVEDLEEVLSIDASSSPMPWSKQMFLGEMRHPHGHCFVIRLEGGPVLGFLCFRTLGEESELLNLAVHPRFRRQGIGTHLMDFYLGFCRKSRVKRCYLEVNRTNWPAIRLYENFTYRTVGVRPRFYQGKFDALLLQRTL